MELWLFLSGWFVGLLIGSTGIGGGLIMTPLLIFGFHLPPSIAVGTDLIFASITKIFGAWQHWRQKTIDFALLKWVSLGSIPGTILGISLLHYIQSDNKASLDVITTKGLAVTFLLISITMFFSLVKNVSSHHSSNMPPHNALTHSWIVLLCGLLVGFLVALTSVGSGTLFLALLYFLYPFRTANLVGTDIIHGVIITGLAGIAHTFFGTVDMYVAILLLAGSIPGVLLGSKLTLKIPDRFIRLLLIGMLVLSALKLLI